MSRTTAVRLSYLMLLLPVVVPAQRFYPDDPLWKEPPPRTVGKIAPQRLDNLIDFYKNTFHEKGERHRPDRVIPAIGVNTLGEVPDSAWYTNRHSRRRMTLAELATGPNRSGPPSSGSKWTVTSAKAEGVTPGFTIRDDTGRRYLLKFDPKSNPELATGADAVSARFFYALGYHVPENYAIRFRRDQLTVGSNVNFTDKFGRERKLTDKDVDEMLEAVQPYEDGTYRALASFYIAGEPVGPFKYYGRRGDDPNEIGPHEHLRVLRGLYVFAAWLNHTDAKSLNSLDVVLEENGTRYIKHHLIDFGASLGSDSLYAKDPRLGHEYFLAVRPGIVQLATLGLYVPKYARVRFPEETAVGNFTSQAFDPDTWKSNYPNAAFENRLPGDEFWAAKQVMAFSGDEIRAMVQIGNYTDPETSRRISEILIERQNAIGRTFFSKVLPLDDFKVEEDRLNFEDLSAKNGIGSTANYEISWTRFNNANPAELLTVAGSGPQLPATAKSAPVGSYWSARIHDSNRKKSVRVTLRKQDKDWVVVGIEREGERAWRPK